MSVCVSNTVQYDTLEIMVYMYVIWTAMLMLHRLSYIVKMCTKLSQNEDISLLNNTKLDCIEKIVVCSPSVRIAEMLCSIEQLA